jgi:hypothetical protein
MPYPAITETREVFDYTILDAEISHFVQQQTDEIRALFKRTAQGIVEIGQKLISVKQRLGHGRFLDWLQAEFEWTERTAQQFMNVARSFKNENFSNLQLAPSALYILAAPSTPQAVRSEALARAKAGEPITHKAAKAIKQKYTLSVTKPKPEPESEPEPQLTSIPAAQSESKLEIVAIRRQAPAPAQTPDIVMLPQVAQALSVPQPSQPFYAAQKPGVWWRLGGRHLLYCGDPNSPDFIGQITQKVSLLLAFLPTPDWYSRISADVRIMMSEYLPQCSNRDRLDEILETNVLLHSNLGDLVVSCFLPSPDILSVINRLDRRGLLAEQNSKRLNAIILDWKKAGLKAERLGSL